MDEITTALPYLRRYARALTGSQKAGDQLAVKTLETLLESGELAERKNANKILLFKTLNDIFDVAGAGEPGSETPIEARAQKHLASLKKGSREALLMQSIEQFSVNEIAEIMQISSEEVRELVEVARKDIADSVSGSILVIEDEGVIARDIENIATEMGHRVSGIAATHIQAVKMAATEPPDLILADIQLADNSSGIDAVNEILRALPTVPVIFITAFPERLLSGERPEPAFLISKPYSEDQVISAVSQAMFFASTETLTG